MYFMYLDECKLHNLEYLKQIYRDNDYALEGSFESWIEYELDQNGLIAFEEVPMEKTLGFVCDYKDKIRKKFEEMVFDTLIEKVDCVLEALTDVVPVWTGDVLPEDSLKIGRLISELTGVITNMMTEVVDFEASFRGGDEDVI